MNRNCIWEVAAPLLQALKGGCAQRDLAALASSRLGFADDQLSSDQINLAPAKQSQLLVPQTCMNAQEDRGIQRPGPARSADREQTMLLVVGECASDLIPHSQHADVWLDVCPKGKRSKFPS
jgi:hypothetical protein